MKNKRIILLDDDLAFLRILDYHAKSEGFSTVTCTSALDAIKAFEESPSAVIVTDIVMPQMGGISFIEEIRKRSETTSIIVVSGLASIEDAVEAMKLGAVDVIRKPLEPNHFVTLLQKAYRMNQVLEENVRLRNLVDTTFRFGTLIGSSPVMNSLYEAAKRIAVSQATCLISGETGVGKEILAKAIHLNSPRKEKAFVTLNCAAIPENLLESELFGHVKGAFTGAVNTRSGLLTQADGGTFFFDEIGDLPLSLQPKLLRVLQEQSFHPVGSNERQTVDIRFICATHRDLSEMVRTGQFREDLFYRLNIVPLSIPPVRSRKEDILLLFHHFLTVSCNEEQREKPNISPEILHQLEHYSWPGNVREIQNICKRLAVLSGTEIKRTDLPFASTESAAPISPVSDTPFDLEEYIDDIFISVLQRFNWNQSKTARFLKVSRNTVAYRLKRKKLQDALDKS